ncbi:MAG TPA: hypothetical protein VF062_20600 [Candidatus Limnocylindrales bacterium]
MIQSRRIIACLSGALVAATAVVAIPAPAHASGGCSGSLIIINANPGAEQPSVARGHTHATGNHYVKSTYPVGDRRIFVWYADNNGGLDGDTRDSYHTSSTC